MTVRTFANDISKDDGRFKRTASVFRDKISSAPGSVFSPEKGRYHLYVSLACPWATRTLLCKSIKGIDDDVIGWSKVHWLLDREAGGWKFSPEEGYVDNLHPDTKLLRELYLKSNPNYDGKITTPVLWDEKTQQIVNNESSEIISMINSSFNEWAKHPEIDLYPEELRSCIDEINDFIYEGLNNGVYRAGFAQTQKAYEEACQDVFRTLDRLEQMLASRRYLASDTDITFADVRAFVTLIRFDAVYHGHFKCNLRRIKDMPNLWAYLRDLYQRPEFSGATDFHDIKYHYYGSHKHINPFGIVPLGPDLSELNEPHGRDKKIETAQEDLG